MREDRPTYRPGVREDFDRLFRDSYHRILFTLTGVLRDPGAAEECAQEAFVRAYPAWGRWKPEAPAEAWVHRIALNVAISHRRRERLRGLGEVLRRKGPPRAQRTRPGRRGGAHRGPSTPPAEGCRPHRPPPPPRLLQLGDRRRPRGAREHRRVPAGRGQAVAAGRTRMGGGSLVR